MAIHVSLKHIICLSLSFLVFLNHLSGQSLSEKKESLRASDSGLDPDTERFLQQINQETLEIHQRIRQLYGEVNQLYNNNASEEDFRLLLSEINEQRRYLNHLEETWREMASRQSNEDLYGLWHAPDTNLEQLIIDYGSQDYVYLIPPEVGGIRLSINSNLPIPRASWNEMLELILSQNGVGLKELNPYLRQLYLFKENHSDLKTLTNRRIDLEILPPNARVGFVISPEASDVNFILNNLQFLTNPVTTILQRFGRDILVIGKVTDVQDILKMFDFLVTNRGAKDYRLIPVSKLPATEMARILETIFDQIKPGPEGGVINEPNGLKVIILQNMAQALFIVGTRDEVQKATDVIQNIEESIGGARDRVVYWYTVKHSEPEELADILFRIYNLMVATGTGYGPLGYGPGNGFPGPFGGAFQQQPPGGGPPQDVNKVVVVNTPGAQNQGPPIPPPPPLPYLQKEPPPTLYGQEGYYQEGGYVVNPAPAQPRIFAPTEANVDRDNFIVDLKTGAIVMVVEVDTLPKLKELMRKLDVPKKMVHIETLLFEKILTRSTSYGLNLLRIGDAAANLHLTGGTFNNIAPLGLDAVIPGNAGVTEFFISRKKTSSGIPAFDAVYRFLLNQDDIQFNSCPSITTLNQTPATIAINEDISINTGIFEVETAKGVTLKDAYTRAQYGITISIKPTIHISGCEEDDQDYDYVTLETDITFDTIHPGGDPTRPDVTRRHITNMVDVADGESIILGGLRRKNTQDSKEAIPFIGELPGIGKLFSINSLEDSSTEMFILLTPHIIKDPKDHMRCLRQELLCVRPGDIPYYLQCVEEAHLNEKNRLMQGSMTILFGRPRERYYMLDVCTEECGEYEGG
ncbi:MAG: type II secretion system protein GspD [Parachlamydiaceae bacterium]|nr:type II secretion system protein GspD [Parachlamydiaceae bacterium]